MSSSRGSDIHLGFPDVLTYPHVGAECNSTDAPSEAGRNTKGFQGLLSVIRRDSKSRVCRLGCWTGWLDQGEQSLPGACRASHEVVVSPKQSTNLTEGSESTVRIDRKEVPCANPEFSALARVQ